MEPQDPGGGDARPTAPGDSQDLIGYDELRRAPAWLLGCGLALLTILLIFNLLGPTGILFPARGLPVRIARGWPFLIATAASALLLWGFGMTVALGSAWR